MATFHSIWTVLMLVLFIGIWAWAWSSRRKSSFDDAARLPFADENDKIPPTRHGENN